MCDIIWIGDNMDGVQRIEETLNNEFDFDSNRYFYHITSKGTSKLILEEGLFLEEPKLNSTTVEITIDMMEGIGEYIKNEYMPNSVMKREEMVILGIPYDEVAYSVEKSVGMMPFVIDNKYVLGYIDLKTLEFYENYNYEFGNHL